MGLSTGTRLGPYEITGSLGAGGMGEVYRARDTRVDREVALKVLPGDFLEGEEGRARRERFEREARLLASLNHPNIAVLYSFEEISGRHVLAMELLEGESLRGKLGAPVPPRRAVEIAVHIAHGLAAAHEKSVVHRDLKPENVFVTKDGWIKLLDFGIAKLTQPTISSAPLTEAPTETPATGAGVVLGTVGYMSPEQVLGKTLDARSDLFSLGVVLYEMLSGKRPFHKDSAPETMTAILREEPPDLGETGRNIPPGLDRIVRHCLEKEPSARFQSAHDVAFALESLSQATTGGAAPLRGNLAGRRRAAAALAILSVFAVGAGAFFWGARTGRTPVPTFKRITLRRGLVTSAFFTPDFQSVVYSAQWEGRPSEVFVQRLASADARPLGLGADVVGSAGGDVAVLRQGVLARLPLEGVVGQAPSFDTIGWFARDADLLGRIGEILFGTDLQSANRPRHVMIATDAFAIAETATASALLPAAEGIAKLAGSGEKRALSQKVPLADWLAHQRAIQGREAWATFGDWIDAHNPRFAFEISDNFIRGMQVDDATLAAAREFQRARRAELMELLEPDVIVCLPTAPFPAPRVGQPRSAMWAHRTAISTLTAIAGTLAAPQLNLPLARVDGLPVGLSILARPGADEMLLAFAREVAMI